MMNKFVIIFILSLLSFPIHADQFSIMAENDLIFKTDNYYTHGTRFQYTRNDYGYCIGQNIYTPNNKKATYLIPNDRPYAGYLYASIFHTYYLDNGNDFFLEGQLGVVGPYSYAKQTQIWVHEKTKSEMPMGWSNQIPDHLAFVLQPKYTWHVYDNKYFAIDPYVGGTFGNVADYINVGFNIYGGYNLPSDRNNPRTIPFKATENNWNPYAYVYLGLEPKIMLYSMFLQDNRFTIHPETFLYDRNTGIIIGCNYFEIAFTWGLRSKEFEEQLGAEKYGSAKISFKF